MASAVLIKRGLSTSLPSLTLQNGEPAFTTDTNKLYVGSNGKKIVINDGADRFAVCATAAATVKKEITVNGDFQLTAGAWVFVLFTNTNSATAPTLSVNGTDAKPIYYKNAAITASNLTNTRLHLFLYDGAQYELVGDIDTNTTYTAMTAAELETGTSTAARSITPKVLVDWLKSWIGLTSGKLVGVGADGKIDLALIPHQAITEVFVVATEAAMLALSDAHTGDIAIRTDVNKTFILQQPPATTLANWIEISTPQIDDTTLAAKVRAVVLTGLATGTNAAIAATDTILGALAKLQAQINAKANLASPTFTGAPKAPTAAAGDNSTQLSTTAFVQTAIGTIDGGTF